jgi:hypothetical protein
LVCLLTYSLIIVNFFLRFRRGGRVAGANWREILARALFPFSFVMAVSSEMDGCDD